MVGSDKRDDTSTNSSTTIDRRDVLRSTAGLAVGAAGVAAATSPGSATLEALIEAGRCSGEDAWDEAPADYPVVDLQESSASQIGTWPDDPDELTIFVHGLGGDSNQGWKRQAVTFENAAEANGFDTPQVAALYQTRIEGSLAWSDAVGLAKTAGQRLASWLRSYDSQHDISSYNVVAHSLGGHVTGTLLNELDGDIVIDNVALLGPAIPADSVCEGSGEYAGGIVASAGDVYNYHSSDDAVVCDLYSSYLFGAGTTGLGCEEPGCGWSGSAPANFHDNDVSRSVSEHCNYPKGDVGCVDQVADAFASDDGDDGTRDGDDSGDGNRDDDDSDDGNRDGDDGGDGGRSGWW